MTLSLMEALDLDVKESVRVERDAKLGRDEVREPLLVLLLDGHPQLLERGVLGVLPEAPTRKRGEHDQSVDEEQSRVRL